MPNNNNLLAVLGSALLLTSMHANCAVSPEVAQQLGANLTPFGAVQAGNADGSIPAYEPQSARIIPPATYKDDGVRPNPFAEDQPLLVITSQNMDQYAERLSEGTKAMLRKWPSYEVRVYPTRRTAWYPAWVLDNTRVNAQQAQMVGRSDGVANARGGIPFPIPTSGAEVIWNHNLSWAPEAVTRHSPGYLIDTRGSRTELSTQDNYFETPYYKREASAPFAGPYLKVLVETRRPIQANGRRTLIHYSANYAEQEQRTWIYTPGQRRVRLAPDFKYDTPVSTFGGAIFYDEVLLYSGNPDRYDWTLVGQKEMYIPDNTYDFASAGPDQVLGKQHVDPALVRWELQRVWEVEGRLRDGERHVYTKRTFYYNGDTWKLTLTDNYDYSGTLARSGQNLCIQAYDSKEPQFAACSSLVYDLKQGQYSIEGVRPRTLHTALRPAQTTQPATLAGQGIR